MNALLKSVLSIFLLVISFSVLCQKTESFAPYPLKYSTPTVDIDFSVETNPQDLDSSRPWIIFADRSELKIFDKPGGEEMTLLQVQLGDCFIVLNETEDYVQIVKDPEFGINFSNNKTILGWVKKEEMLLWRTCYNNIAAINSKAILINKENTYTNTEIPDLENINKVRFYNDPNLISPTDFYSDFFEIFYIYKITKNAKGDTSVLLGNSPKILLATLQNANEFVKGWIPLSSMINMDGRLFIDLNLEEKAMEERRRVGIKSTIFRDKVSAMIFKKGYYIQDAQILWNNDTTYDNILNGYRMRFPLLELKTDSIALVYVFGEESHTVSILKKDSIPTFNKYKTQIARIGWAPFYVKDLKYPLFSFVYLMDYEDLFLLHLVLTRLQEASSPTTLRVCLIESLREIFKGLSNQVQFKDQDINDVSINSLWSPLWGVSALQYDGCMKDITINDLEDPNKVSDQELDNIVKKINDRKFTVQKAFQLGKDYEYSFVSNDIIYFWIPVEFFLF